MLRHVTRHAGAVAACLVIFVAGCGVQSQEPSVAVVDSAGVEIIRTTSPLWPSGSPWTISDASILAIGEVEGSRYEVFSGVSGVVRLGDGRIVVADGGSSEIRFFGPDGRFLGASGRSGGGPGEFRILHKLYVLGRDSLLAFDGGLYRFSMFDSTGVFVRVFQPEQAAQGLVWPLAVIGHRRILLGAGQPFGGQRAPGVHTDSATFMIADLGGAIETVVGRFPFYERYVHIYADGIRSTIGLPFGRETRVAAGGGRIYLTISDGFQIYVHGIDGRLERIFRIPRELRPVTETDVERYVESRRRVDNPRRRRVEARLLREIPFPETFPPFADLMLDTEGYLWAEEYHMPGERSARWIVFDPDGRWLGTVEGPEGFRAHQIGRDYVLGVHVDDLGVEQIRMYRLSRS